MIKGQIPIIRAPWVRRYVAPPAVIVFITGIVFASRSSHGDVIVGGLVAALIVAVACGILAYTASQHRPHKTDDRRRQR